MIAVLVILALPVLRGLLDYAAFYKLLRGESRTPRWAARTVILGKHRPYHVALALLDGLCLWLLWQHAAPAVAASYLVLLLFAVPDALFYHVWKPFREKRGGRGRSILPVKSSLHRKAYPLWPVQHALCYFWFRGPLTEGEYRACAVMAYLLVAFYAFTVLPPLL